MNVSKVKDCILGYNLIKYGTAYICLLILMYPQIDDMNVAKPIRDTITSCLVASHFMSLAVITLGVMIVLTTFFNWMEGK